VVEEVVHVDDRLRGGDFDTDTLYSRHPDHIGAICA
jgi:hypothetical protein